jgi:hypothetical protein
VAVAADAAETVKKVIAEVARNKPFRPKGRIFLISIGYFSTVGCRVVVTTKYPLINPSMIHMRRKNISTDNIGVSAIVVVVILLVAAVAVASAYIVLKDDDKDNNANETILEGKLGVGTVLYYDTMPSIGSIMTTSGTAGITGEIVGENGTHYFFEYGDRFNSYITVRIHKETGAVDSASSVNGKWTLEITNENGDVIIAEMVIGQLGDRGNIISTISITMNGHLEFYAEVRSAGHNIIEPSEYRQSEYFGKYHKYDMYSLTTVIIPGTISYEIETTGYIKTSVVGTAANNTMMVLMEGYMKVESNTLLIEDLEYYFEEYIISTDLLKEVPEFPKETSNLVYEGTERITVAGKSVQAKEYTFNMTMEGINVNSKFYISMDDRIIYLYEMEGGGYGTSTSMSVKYVEGNL